MLSLSRPDISLLVSVMTGHCLIGRHAVRLRVAASDFCRSCGDEEEEESIEHLLCTCPALARRRVLYLGSYFFGDLGELAGIDIGRLRGFLRQSGWFNGGS